MPLRHLLNHSHWFPLQSCVIRLTYIFTATSISSEYKSFELRLWFLVPYLPSSGTMLQPPHNSVADLFEWKRERKKVEMG